MKSAPRTYYLAGYRPPRSYASMSFTSQSQTIINPPRSKTTSITLTSNAWLEMYDTVQAAFHGISSAHQPLWFLFAGGPFLWIRRQRAGIGGRNQKQRLAMTRRRGRTVEKVRRAPLLKRGGPSIVCAGIQTIRRHSWVDTKTL